MPAYLEALSSTPTPWVCAACASLLRDWTENRAPQPGDVRKRASMLMHLHQEQARTQEVVKQIAAPPPMVKFNLAAEMRAAANRWDALTDDERDAKHEEWLRVDIARGRISETTARRMRAERGATR